MTNRDTIAEPEGQIPIVRRADLAGRGRWAGGHRRGGRRRSQRRFPSCFSRRYAYLGGLASGGMVLVPQTT